MKSNKIFAIAFFVIVSVVVLGVFLLSNRNLSSHHASINMHLSENDSRDSRLLVYEKVLETMKDWAEESDMYFIENSNDKGNLSSFTSNPDADVREFLFKDKLSSEGPMPLQVMGSYDANGSLQIVRIMFAQGYSKEPSERLKKISSDLHSRLVKMNEKTYYSIW